MKKKAILEVLKVAGAAALTAVLSDPTVISGVVTPENQKWVSTALVIAALFVKKPEFKEKKNESPD